MAALGLHGLLENVRTTGAIPTNVDEWQAALRQLEQFAADPTLSDDQRLGLGEPFLMLGWLIASTATQPIRTDINELIRRCFESAIELCPQRTDKYLLLAILHLLKIEMLNNNSTSWHGLLSRLETVQSKIAPSELGELLFEYDDLLMENCSESLRYVIQAAQLKVARHLNASCGGELDVRQFDPALNLFRRAFSLGLNSANDELIEALFEAGASLHLQSNYEEAIQYIRTALELQEKRALAHPLGKSNIRFFHNRSAILMGIGHQCSEVDVFLKMGQLQWRPERKPILLAPEKKVANRALADYWMEHICFVTDSRLAERLQPLKRELEYNSFWIPLPNKFLHHFSYSIIAVQKMWESKGYASILKLKEKHRREGWKYLRAMGVPENAWFVGIHVRDQRLGKAGVKVNAFPTSHRDCEIDTYTEAMRAITDRGGWVIRIGDPSMKPMPKLPQTIDLTRAEDCYDWMDLFVASECRFFIATASGPGALPTTFGNPVIHTNISPMNGYGQGLKDLYIPKLFRSRKTNKFVSFKESLTPPLYMCVNTSVFEACEVDIIENSPEELRDITIEMIEQLEGKSSYDLHDGELQERFRRITEPFAPYGYGGRVGREFLRKYEALLPP